MRQRRSALLPNLSNDRLELLGIALLLASLAVVGGTTDSDKIYGIVFVVVLFSVVVQGTGLRFVASALGVPMENHR